MAAATRAVVVLSVAVLSAVMLTACPSESKPDSMEETVDVDQGLDIDTSGDQQAASSQSGLAGILPSDFPSDLPLYVPASLIDFGESPSGRATVSLLSPHSISRVRRELYARLRESGWTAAAGSDGAVVLEKDRRKAWLRLEEGQPGTRYHFEY